MGFLKKIFLAILFTLVPISAFSANCGVSADTYYVDFTVGVGDDTANGTSSSTPWKHSPGDDNATGNAVCSLQAGDTVIFKGGVSYLGRIDLDFSGSDGSVITYDGNSAGTWGTGNAIISGENINSSARKYGFYTAATGKQYITIQNFNLTKFGGVADYTGYSCSSLPPAVDGYGVFLNGASYVTIKDSNFYEIGHWDSTKPITTTLVSGAGINIQGETSNITVDTCDFTKMSTGVNISGGVISQTKTASDIEVKNSNIHNYMRWGVVVDAAYDNTTVNNISIHDNQIHDFTEYDVPWLTSGACGLTPHTDFIFLSKSIVTGVTWGSAAKPIKIYNNKFYQNATVGGGTATIFLSGMGGTVWIYNNLFINTLHSYGGIYVQDGVSAASGNSAIDYHIYNNSFYDSNNAITLRSMTVGYELDSVAGNNINIRNNIFHDTNTGSKVPVYAYSYKKLASKARYSMSGLATAEETFVVDDHTFTWKASRSGHGEVTIGSTNVEAAANIVTAINADMTTVVASLYSTGSNIVVVTYYTTGPTGNSVVFTEASTNMTIAVSTDIPTGYLNSYQIGRNDYTGSSNPTTLDHNHYLVSRGDGLVVALDAGNATEVDYTVANISAVGGFAGGDTSGNTIFTDISYGLGANSSSNDLSLQSGSPAREIGSDLSTYFTKDYLNLDRPNPDGLWDAGAYEYVAGHEDVTYYTVTISKTGNGCSINNGAFEVIATESIDAIPVLNGGWQGTWGGTCGATGAVADGIKYTKTPTADCTITITCTAILVFP